MARRGGALNAEKQLGEAFAAARQFHVTTPSASISPINLQRAWSAFQRSAPPYVRASHSHGIVIIGGGPRYLTPTLTSVCMLRKKLNTSLPIELWMLDDEVPAASSAAARLFVHDAPMQVKFRSVRRNTFASNSSSNVKHAGFTLKLVAAVLSSFEQLVLLDADAHPLVDPETHLFTDRCFIRQGAVLFWDYWQSSISASLLRATTLQTAQPSRASHEAGQAVLHRRRKWNVLLYACFLSAFGATVYPQTVSNGFPGAGDKELLPIAFKAMDDLQWFDVPKPPATVGSGFRPTGRVFNGFALLHHLPCQPGYAFLHLNCRMIANRRLRDLHRGRRVALRRAKERQLVYARVFWNETQPEFAGFARADLKEENLKHIKVLRGGWLEQKCRTAKSPEAEGIMTKDLYGLLGRDIEAELKQCHAHIMHVFSTTLTH